MGQIVKTLSKKLPSTLRNNTKTNSREQMQTITLKRGCKMTTQWNKAPKVTEQSVEEKDGKEVDVKKGKLIENGNLKPPICEFQPRKSLRNPMLRKASQLE